MLAENIRNVCITNQHLQRRRSGNWYRDLSLLVFSLGIRYHSNKFCPYERDKSYKHNKNTIINPNLPFQCLFGKEGNGVVVPLGS